MLVALILNLNFANAYAPIHSALFRQCAAKYSIEFLDKPGELEKKSSAEQKKILTCARDLNRRYSFECMNKAGIRKKPEIAPKELRVPYEKCMAERLRKMVG